MDLVRTFSTYSTNVMRTQQTQSSGDSVSPKGTEHIPVLLQEVIHWLDIATDDVIFDGTLGGAGHAKALAELLGKEGVLIGTDVDSKAIRHAETALAKVEPRVILAHTNFKDIKKVCKENNVASINKVLLDLGWSSDQIAEAGRGLSFQKNELLSMRLSDTQEPDALTAHEIVNQWSEESIADVLYGWGGERYAKRIAKAIGQARQERDINTTGELVEIIKRAVPSTYRYGRINPATRTFQALRIAVNDEIRALEVALGEIADLLAEDGRVAIISFHSVEDRVVKHTFKKWAQENLGDIFTKKPIKASEEEVENNPRARSAKLRIFHKYEK